MSLQNKEFIDFDYFTLDLDATRLPNNTEKNLNINKIKRNPNELRTKQENAMKILAFE